MFNFKTSIPFSLYIHLPWCVRKCPYCDFNSHVAADTLPEALYIQRLVEDIDEQLPRIWGRRLTSIFFGGGTPSLFSPAAIEKILLEINARLPFQSDLEITLEANPGTVDQARFKGFKDAGINRLSIGIQSLNDQKLKILGRIHNKDYALNAINAAIEAGFENFNLDLMHGLPGQTLQEALLDLKEALCFNPPHVSWYQLTIEPNTAYFHQPPPLPEEDILYAIQEEGKIFLTDHQLMQYEISAYSQKEKECRHNKNYWEFGDYLGIGAGAHSKITDIENQCITRHWQVKHPKDYLAKKHSLTESSKILSVQDTMIEFMLNALRLTQGVPLSLFVERTGLDVSVLTSRTQKAIEKGLLENTPSLIKPTELGFRYLNDLINLF